MPVAPLARQVFEATYEVAPSRSATSFAFSSMVARTITSHPTRPSRPARSSVQPQSAAASCVFPHPRGTWSISSRVFGRPSAVRRATNMATTQTIHGDQTVGPAFVGSFDSPQASASASRSSSQTTPDPGSRSAR